MFTIALALIESMFKIKFCELYLGTIILDICLMLTISDIVKILTTK